MRAVTGLAMMLVALAGGAAAQGAKDVAGAKDHPLVGRYQGAVITSYTSSDFDEQRLIQAPVDLRADGEKFTDGNSVKTEGKVFRIRYDAPKERSGLEILRNYEDSLKAKGFVIVYSCANETCFKGAGSAFRLATFSGDGAINYRYGDGARYLLAKADRSGGTVHAAVFVGESKTQPLVKVLVVEEKPMQGGQIAFIDASAMANAIGASGHVALYGIQFDYDKAELKPESAPTLAEIAKLMKASPALNVVVAGHTDNQGAFDYNVDLSRRRAASVVAALTKLGVAGQRLTPFGAGMAAPLASNDDEAGRAKNRRVEIVKR